MKSVRWQNEPKILNIQNLQLRWKTEKCWKVWRYFYKIFYFYQKCIFFWGLRLWRKIADQLLQLTTIQFHIPFFFQCKIFLFLFFHSPRSFMPPSILYLDTPFLLVFLSWIISLIRLFCSLTTDFISTRSDVIRMDSQIRVKGRFAKFSSKRSLR